MNVTEPNLAAGCSGEDSIDYVFSTKGFDPCHFFTPDQKMTIKYSIMCKPVDNRGLVIDGHPEGLGYPYVDLVSNPRPLTEFKYIENNETNLKLLESTAVSFNLDFRDWKYMSNYQRFSQEITDPLVLKGLKTQSIEIDFSKLNQGEHIVGGRAHFEASVFAQGITSYYTNGFFDQKDYQEPME